MDWTAISSTLTVGQTFESRPGKAFTITAVDAKGYTIARAGTASAVRITAAKVLKAHQMLTSGQSIAYQATPSNGGISYTVAVTVGALHPLRALWTLNNTAKTYTPKGEG